ncbi:MAG: YceH family protein [Opitutaceae bacterium]
MESATNPSSGTPPAEPLSQLEARVLGSLIEKELTTPEYYPLSLNALVNACNQKSNRNPVIVVSAREVEIALDGLRRLRLAGLFSGADARVAKFKQTIDLVYPMETADRVVLCELLLRGAQTTGELRGRCERMHSFPDTAAVEASLDRLIHRPAGPLVARLPRQPGQKEDRVTQLLTGEPDLSSPASETEHPPGAPLTVEVRLPAEAEARFAALEAEVASLREQLADLRRQLGVS